MTQIASPPMPQRVICDLTAEDAGATLVAVGGVHGNEPAGILAAEAVSGLIADQGGPRRGRFTALRGNLAALAIDPDDPTSNPRYIAEDLNRLFRSERGERQTADHTQRDELRRVLDRIADESRGPVYVLDLHTTSSDSPPFIAVEDSLPARRFAERFPLPLILGIEEDLHGLLMQEATERLRCVALTVEGGRHDSTDAVHTLEAVLLIALRTLGLAPDEITTSRGDRPHGVARRAAGPHAHRFYDVRHREPVRALPYEPDPAVEPFDRVRANRTRIARQAGEDLIAVETGLLFMPNRQRRIRVGDDAYFIARRVGRVWLRLSAWLRTRPGIHSELPKILPGVRHRPGYPDDLLVDPEIAALLRREMFHLLGYRLVRFDSTPPPPPLARAARALGVTLRAIARIIGNLIRRGSADTHVPEDRSDWIVRRHRLDISPSPAMPRTRR